MLTDARTVSPGSVLTAEVAVIGAGPGGLTVANEIARRGLNVMIIEAGSEPYDRADRRQLGRALRDHLNGAQSLTRGYTTGEPYFPLRMSRARGIAGSANALKDHGLRSRPLDPVDFDDRFGAGWPMPYSEFASHLEDAARYCGLPQAPGGSEFWRAQPFPEDSNRAVVMDFLNGDRRAFPERVHVLRSSNLQHVLTKAVVTGFLVGETGTVEALRAWASPGIEFLVQARVFVLAAGGIDNPRLLLSSPELLRIMGPARRNVGRYFMEHLHYVPGHVIPSSEAAAKGLRALFSASAERHPMLALSDDEIRRGHLRRSVFALDPVHPESLHHSVRAAGNLLRAWPYGPFDVRARGRQAMEMLRGSRHVAQAALARFGRQRPKSMFALIAMTEQAPLVQSRVHLSNKRDKTGLPLPVLDWKVSDADFDDMRTTLTILDKTLSDAGLGQVVSVWDHGGDRPEVVRGGWHHMGTTRMAARPEDGVVDSDCRVHGVPNLFIAGSSVFPTGGVANPTLSLVALAVRLGEAVASDFAGRPAH